MCLLAFCTEEILANRLMISSRLHGIVEKDHTQYVSFIRPGRYSLEIQEMIHQPDRRRWLMLIIVLSAALVVVFDAFIVNVAIPSIQRSLHASFAELQLVVAGYTLAFAVLLVTGGRMGDLYGRKRVFVLGMAGFTLFSGCCGLAPNALSLIVFRIVQGAAAALMFPQVVSFIQVSFEQAERSRAFGYYVAISGLASIWGKCSAASCWRAISSTLLAQHLPCQCAYRHRGSVGRFAAAP